MKVRAKFRKEKNVFFVMLSESKARTSEFVRPTTNHYTSTACLLCLLCNHGISKCYFSNYLNGPCGQIVWLDSLSSIPIPESSSGEHGLSSYILFNSHVTPIFYTSFLLAFVFHCFFFSNLWWHLRFCLRLSTRFKLDCKVKSRGNKRWRTRFAGNTDYTRLLHLLKLDRFELTVVWSSAKPNGW